MTHENIVRNGVVGRLGKGMIKVSYDFVMSGTGRSRSKDISFGEHIGYSKYLFTFHFSGGPDAAFVGITFVFPTHKHG